MIIMIFGDEEHQDEVF